MAEYVVTDEFRKALESRYKRHGPSGDSPQRHGVVMDAVMVLALTLARVCPSSRERDLALEELERCQFWANAAIARHEQ